MRLRRSPCDRNIDLLLRPGTLYMEHLHTIRCGQGLPLRSRGYTTSGGIESKVSAMVVAARPGEAKSLFEEIIEFVSGGEGGEVQADDDRAAVLGIREDFVEDLGVFALGYAFVGYDYCAWAVGFEVAEHISLPPA